MSEINESHVPPDSQDNNSASTGNAAESSSKKYCGKGRKRKLFIGAIVVLFLITGIAGIGFAKHKSDKFRGDHGPHGFKIGRILKDLDLTAQQKTEVEKIKDEIKTKMKEKRQNRTDNMGELEQMFRGDTFDKQKALELANKRDAEREEMKSFMIEQTAKVHALLTADQRNKAADKMKEMREKRKEHRNKGNK